MHPSSPEKISIQKMPIIALKASRIEQAEHIHEISVDAENVAAAHWQNVVEQTQADGKEIGFTVFFDRISRKYIKGPNFIGDEKSNTVEPYLDTGKGLKGFRKFLQANVVEVHTHSLLDEEAKFSTSVPSSKDLRRIMTDTAAGSMLVLDKGGAHLIMKTGEPKTDQLPPKDFVKKLVDQIAPNGTVAQLQRLISTGIAEYGLSYFYHAGLTPNPDNPVTFRRI